ncbi:PREDICTED: senescence-associated carboxylesterase 101-like isoform X2 [Nelumbo nucifera]|uniref:Senescence-associated carboxylesterase 101-like isoform X2 n=1 Tax=Nelumbo nucifera TaxID=4432 RepID=A0A1U8A1C8_NELNU|nr:PREDICTED: senescence-associated carboxylesterase 101-like isoform X2 [Nelumbo nucifera]
MSQTQSSSSQQFFSCGQQISAFVVASDLLSRLWESISTSTIQRTDPSKELTFQKQELPGFTIIALVTSPSCAKHQHQFLSPQLQRNDKRFKFLCTKDNPSFHINEVVLTLFESLYDELSSLLIESAAKAPLILTGHYLGGAVASLYTLWLLQNIPAKAKLPLCISFGSPLIGDDVLVATLRQSTWNSRFLHVVSNDDPIPRLFVLPGSPVVAADDTMMETNFEEPSSIYKPFGTFLMCSRSGHACFNHPETILELLRVTWSSSSGGRNPGHWGYNEDYGMIIQQLKHSLAYSAPVVQFSESPQRTSILLQLQVLGLLNNDNSNVWLTSLEEREKTDFLLKEKRTSDDKKLNDMKINMANLEWYKKLSKGKGGYYDCYKNKHEMRDIHVEKFKKELTNYWKEKVEEAEKKPQKEGAQLRTRWLYGGTNYRRMVEPLDIAAYYRRKEPNCSTPGEKDYCSKGRSSHYRLLEKWQAEEAKQASGEKKKVTAASLTEDSCFWARVEDARTLLENNGGTESVTDESMIEKMEEFENYVMDLIEKLAVSPEIFLEGSTFMQWWNQYEQILECDRSSPLIDYMRVHRYRNYG